MVPKNLTFELVDYEKIFAFTVYKLKEKVLNVWKNGK